LAGAKAVLPEKGQTCTEARRADRVSRPGAQYIETQGIESVEGQLPRQLGGLQERVSSASDVWGGAPAEVEFCAF